MNIELFTLSELIEVRGEEGDFSVKVRKKPRYVDMNKCIACGLCAEKCPKKVSDEYNMGMGKRKSIFIRYGQTVPLKYAIDPSSCLLMTRGKCRACEKFCPTGAINFDDREEVVTLKVGSIILSPGYTPFDPSIYESYGYRILPDVVTSLEYERLLSAGGPHMGHLVRPSDGKEPKRVAWVQCVGSREIHRAGNGYCSSVCCMYAIKQALVTKEHLAGQDSGQTIFYMDIRSPNKEFERYYEDARARNVRFVRSRPHSIDPGVNQTGVSITYSTEEGVLVTEEFDMAVLSVGMGAAGDALNLSRITGIELDSFGFARTLAFDPVASTRKGIYVAGGFLAPKAIPRSVTEASAAAAEASGKLSRAKSTLTKEKTYPPERDVSGDEPRIGVFVCSCGINIAGVVNVKELVEYAGSLPHVVFVENNLFTCSTDTQNLIAARIREHDANRIVIAACTPRTHEPLFQDTLREAGLNAHLIEMANIRNQNSWVHQGDPARATEKAKDQIRMALAKAALNVPLESLQIEVVQRALVIGGGLAGMNSALALADQGFETLLVEKSDRLGGNAWHLNETWKGREVRPQLEAVISRVENHGHIEVLKKAEVKNASGSVGRFESDIEVDGVVRRVEYGAAVIAVGAREYQPTEYLYGTDERVMTHLQFESKLQTGKEDLAKASGVVFIQCVGSREAGRMYCSRVCCTHSVQAAIRLKELNPDMDIYILNREMRTYGMREELYRKARELGVIFIRYYRDRKPDVFKETDRLYVQVFDPILQRLLKIPADYLVLASAIVPYDNQAIIELFRCGHNEDGFLNEAHPKLRPVDMSVEGLFLAGLCNYPKPIDEAVAQGKAAAARANVILSKTVMQLDPIKSYVTDRCDGCALCLDVCPYSAIALEEYEKDGWKHRRIQTDKALCKGCGLCAATCPKRGVLVHGFTHDQLEAQVNTLLDVI